MERVLDFYRSQPGVVRVEPMDDEISKTVLDIELSTRTQADGDYENLGYKMVMKKDHRVCLFITDEFEMKHHTTLQFVDDENNIIGCMVSEDEMDEFKARDDVIWVSKDFVMFPDKIGESNGRFVLYPFECKEMDAATGCCDSIASSPALPSDTAMKQRWSIPNDKRIFSLVIGFDE